jgi:hypothetical protein
MPPTKHKKQWNNGQYKRSKLDEKKSPYNMVVGQQESIGKGVDLDSRPAKVKLSHGQVCNLVMQSMDLKTAHYFSTLFTQLRIKENGIAQGFPVIPPAFVPDEMQKHFDRQFISKTPAWVVAYCLSVLPGDKIYCLKPCTSLEASQAVDNAYLLCGSYNVHSEYSVTPANAHVPAHPIVKFSGSKAKQKGTSTVVLYLPSVDLFFSNKFVSDIPRLHAIGSKLNLDELKQVVVLTPLPANALQVRSLDSLPKSGGFLSSIETAYCIQVSSKLVPIKTSTIVECVQEQQADSMMAPDLYTDSQLVSLDNIPTASNDPVDAGRLFNTLLSSSSTNRNGAGQFVSGSFYLDVRKSLPNAYLVDVPAISDTSEVLLRVTNATSNNTMKGLQTTIRIQRMGLKERELAHKNAVPLSDTMCTSSVLPKVRKSKVTMQQCAESGVPFGFDGSMHCVGEHVFDRDTVHTIKMYSGTDKVAFKVEKCAEVLSSIINNRYHWEAIASLRTLLSYDELPPKIMGAQHYGFTKSMTGTVNLANSSHFDQNDATVGVGVWLERDLHVPTVQWFVFPNLVTTCKGTEHHGVIVHLTDGCMISWHSNYIRHCTSVRLDGHSNTAMTPIATNGNIYSYHFVNSHTSLTKYAACRAAEYRKFLEPHSSSNIDWHVFFERKQIANVIV